MTVRISSTGAGKAGGNPPELGEIWPELWLPV